MTKQSIEYTDHCGLVMKAMSGAGLLLGSYDASGKPNIMTIGWGSIGYIWGMPIFSVLVRPSRLTYNNIEHSGCFTVNVPLEEHALACATCGSNSGRDMDKFAETGLTACKAANVLAPEVVECPIVYECQVVHCNDILPEKLDGQIVDGMYMSGDFHRVYFGKILSVRAQANAGELLAKGI